jgi:beta-glucosidase
MKKIIILFITLAILLAGCGSGGQVATETVPTQVQPTVTAQSEATAVDVAPTPTTGVSFIYTDPSQPIEARVEDLLKRMTLDEKIGQMTQVEKGSIKSSDIAKYYLGSILSGGGGSPYNNTPQGWYEMVQGYQNEALKTRLAIPILYGVDAVHGHGNMQNATLFPQNIGLGATNDPALVEKIGRATAEEILASGIPWNFSPVVAVPQDVRWGRTYEGFSENTETVSSLSTAYIKGMQDLQSSDSPTPGQTLFALATPKHFIGDGATVWGSSNQNIMNTPYMLDQGDMQASEEDVRTLFLPPYKSAVDAGAMSVMGSFSSWNGTKMHAQKGLLTDVLKGELGFNGFIVSDWQAIDQIDPDYYSAVVTAINAGIDMNMVPSDYVKFIKTMKDAVAKGDIPESRVDEAVRRILRVKFALGLFEHPMPDTKYQDTVRSSGHLELARQAVRESLVLLKNENSVLPLKKDTPIIFIAGEGANDIGLQSGGWTLQWQGQTGNDNEGTTIQSGIRAAVGANTQVEFNRDADFSKFKDGNGKPLIADVGIVVLAEKPYAEGVGDAADISLAKSEIALIKQTREQSKSVVVILLSGRPRVITDGLPLADAWVAAWLPGTEGGGIADVLFGDYPFTGKTAYSWPRSNKQLPININNSAGKTGCDAPLFPFGYGLAYGEPTPDVLKCNP